MQDLGTNKPIIDRGLHSRVMLLKHYCFYEIGRTKQCYFKLSNQPIFEDEIFCCQAATGGLIHNHDKILFSGVLSVKTVVQSNTITCHWWI